MRKSLFFATVALGMAAAFACSSSNDATDGDLDAGSDGSSGDGAADGPNGSGATGNGSGATGNGSGATGNGSGATGNGSGATGNGSGATGSGSGATGSGSGAQPGTDGGNAGGSGGTGSGTGAAPGAGGFVFGDTACTNGKDDDGDHLVDSEDPECTGPLDNDEETFATGIPGDNVDPKWQDCFFDGDSGAGNDGCRYHTDCITGDKPQSDPACVVTAECLRVCKPLVPNGCDCFGCCEVTGPRGVVKTVSIVSTCTAADVNDPEKCPPCTQSTRCQNDCDECELCIGKDTLPESCNPPPGTGGAANTGGKPNTGGSGGAANTGGKPNSGGTANSGGAPNAGGSGGYCPSPVCARGESCGVSCLPACPSGQYCLTGCCIDSPR